MTIAILLFLGLPIAAMGLLFAFWVFVGHPRDVLDNMPSLPRILRSALQPQIRPNSGSIEVIFGAPLPSSHALRMRGGFPTVPATRDAA